MLSRALLAASMSFLAGSSTLFAAAAGSPILLWPNGAPGAPGQKSTDVPTLTPYLPARDKSNGATMLILPGGGYGHLAAHEGEGYAQWFTREGVTCYVLAYRLGSQGYRHPAMLNDAARALRLVRAFAKRDGLDPNRIGIIGSSAGGHLAATLLTHFDDGQIDAADPIERENSRPDLGILCYPVITLLDPHAHQGSRRNLLGTAPAQELLRELSNELHVTAQTPPCFLWHTVADASVPVENSFLFATALRRAGVGFSLHIYEQGAHGLGMGRPDRPAPPWTEQLRHWLVERRFLR